MILNMGVENGALYRGCEVKEVGGRLSLITPPEKAINLVGRNATKLIEGVDDRSEITLTGPMAVWTYMVVFHIVVHKFSQVWYDDGRGNSLQISQH